MCNLYTVIKRKESIRGQYRTLEIEIELFGFINSLTQRIDAAGLSATFSYQLFVLDQSDGIALQVFANQIAEQQVFFSAAVVSLPPTSSHLL